MEKRKIIGVVLFLIGAILILNSFSSITGFAVAESIGTSISSILGLVLVVGGIVIFMSRGKEKKELGDLLKRSKVIERKLRFDNISDSLRYTDLKAKEKSSKVSRYELFRNKNRYLDNKASRCLFDNNIPESSMESVSDAKGCGYDIFPKEGDGNRVKDKKGIIITELGNHQKNNKNTQRGRYKDMARGSSSWRL